MSAQRRLIPQPEPFGENEIRKVKITEVVLVEYAAMPPMAGEDVEARVEWVTDVYLLTGEYVGTMRRSPYGAPS